MQDPNTGWTDWEDTNKTGYYTARIWLYDAATNLWAAVRTPPPIKRESDFSPVMWRLAASTNKDAFVGYYSSDRVDWYHPTLAGAMVWQQVRRGQLDGDLSVHQLIPVRNAPGRVIAQVQSYNVHTYALYRRTAQGIWIKQLQVRLLGSYQAIQ